MSISERFLKVAQNALPMPMTIAVILTVVVAFICLFMPLDAAQIQNTGEWKILSVLSFWEKGIWELLAFSMQMVLILVLGHSLALSPPVNRLISTLVKTCNNTSRAVVIIAIATMLVSFLNWGLGLIFGSILARKVGEKASNEGIAINYALIGAAGYSGFMIWHGGFSGSAPLKASETGHFLESTIGIIDVSQTLLSPMNLISFMLVLIAVPTLLFYLGKTGKKIIPSFSSSQEKDQETKIEGAEKLDHSKVLGIGFGLVIISFGIYKALTSGGTGLSFLQLNFINFLLLGLGLIFHGSLYKYVKAVNSAVGGSAGIIIQFPIYAGIMGIMKYSGMVNEISQFFLSISNETTLPVLTFFSAALVNVFVPSGGGQWAIQGPIITQAALEMGASIPKNIMALAYGDQITNMIQPFWALPLLGITQLKAKDLLPYTFLMMLVGVVIFVGVLLIF